MKKSPDIIYKYRTWKNPFHKKALTDNEIYFALPNEFNDSFDCNITVDYSKLDNNDKIFEYATKIVVDASKKNKMPKKKMIAEIYRVAEIINSEKDSLQKDNDKFILKKINEHIGVFSASILCDNFLLWSHYADSHRGYCIGYDVKQIKDSIGNSNGGYVHYNDNYPKISPLNEVDLLTSWLQVNYKAQCWEYEKEFRISKLYKQRRDQQNRVSVIPNECIKEIILGAYIDKKNRQEIIEISQEKCIEVFEMRRVPASFKIRKVKL